MQNPELFACLSKERKENLLGTLLFRPSIYERLYYEEEMVRKQIVCYEEFLQIVRNPQIRAAAPEIDFEFEEFSANSYLSLVDEYLYWNKVPGDILLRLKKAAEDALAYARENKNFRQNEETLLGTLHTIQGYLGEISISEMLDTYVNWLNGADPTQYDWMNVETTCSRCSTPSGSAKPARNGPTPAAYFCSKASANHSNTSKIPATRALTNACSVSQATS